VLRRGPITRNRDGSYRIKLGADERELLRTLPAQLREMLTTDDPSLHRLFPPAYLENVERDDEYQRLMREELISRRVESLTLVEETAGADRLTEEQLTAWMKVINDLRLVLGTRLDVREDDDPTEPLDPDDPMTAVRGLYWFLSYLLEAAVDALSGAL